MPSAATPSPIDADPATAGVIAAERVADLCAEHGCTVEQLMRMLVPFAAVLARPALSKFHVGAVVLGPSGNLYYGANAEFPDAALPFTLHAEQSAVTNAWNNGETGIERLAVSAAPCGYCRQFLYETDDAAQMTVIVIGQPQTSLSPGLLPAPFGPNDLGVTAALMAPQSVSLSLVTPSNDPVVLAALAAAELSYAPYTKSYAGVAVLGSDGRIYAGRVAENAAYNPSISPLESALAMVGLAGLAESAIRQVALVELPAPTVSQIAVTEIVAGALGVQNLSVNPAQ
jgi:cytidine deaminase